MSANAEGDREMEYTSSTLKLLQQYENMTLERDKDLDYIEKGDSTLNRNGSGPSYDELFKENVKLRLKVSEYKAEIDELKNLLNELKSTSGEAVVLKHQRSTLQTPQNATICLPPRSADRMKNAKNLTLTDSTMEQLNLPRSPATFQLNKPELQDELKEQTDVTKFSSEVSTSSEKNPEWTVNSPPSNVTLGSPATSVSYTTSRISINSSQSPSVQATSQLRKPDSPSSQRTALRSPQRVNRVTHLINNELHSPLKEQFSDYDEEMDVSGTTVSEVPQDITIDSTAQFEKKSPRVKKLTMDQDINFSPSSKQKLNTFTEMINRTFGDEENGQKQNSPSIESPNFDSSNSPNSKLLASPVKFQNNTNESLLAIPNKKKSDISSSSLLKSSLPENVSAASISTTVSRPYSPRSSSSSSRIPPPTHQTSYTESESGYSTKSVPSTPLISDIPLFVQPDDFPTVAVSAVSTLYINFDDPSKNILFSVVDKSSGKEMFKFAKSFEQILELDNMFKIRLMEKYNLPSLPKKQMFQTTIPIKVDLRRELISDYFVEVFQASQTVPITALKLAQFISTDTVINIPSDDSSKEGILLLRKNKTLGSSTSWKVRYAVIDNQLLLLYDQGTLAESIKMNNSAIELQANLPDDKYGTKNGFIINEPKKSGLSSFNKHFLSAETGRQREEWISALMRICNSNSNSIKTELFNSSQDQGSSSDISLDNSFNGAIGPMVNLESYNKNSPVDPSAVPELDKETKRTRMRSFFPFKKTHAHNSGSTIDFQEVGDESTESSISKALKSMNLDEPEPLTIFGSDVKNSISISSNFYNGNYEIPTVVYRCLEFLYKRRAVSEEGIFRLSGSSALIKSLQEQFERELDINLCEYNNEEHRGGGLLDVNTVTGLLKLYFRSLPHLIFGDIMYDDFRNAAESSSGKPDEIALKFRELVHGEKMQKENYSLMYVLFELLVKINDNNKVNKMNLRNLCIVFSPTLNIPVNILQPFITDFRCIFQGTDPLNNEERQNVDVYIPQISK